MKPINFMCRDTYTNSTKMLLGELSNNVHISLFQSAMYLNGVNVISLEEIALRTEPSALAYRLPTAQLNGLPGLNGVSVLSTQLETVYRQGRELLNVVKR